MTDLEKIKAALAAGPTSGPWTTISRGAYWWEEEADVQDAEGDDIEQAEFVKPVGDVMTTRGQMYMRDAVYIAACSPEVIATLIARLEAAEALATPAPAQPDPLHVANERGEGEPDIESLAETARNAYFGVSRRGSIQFDSIHPQSQQIWRSVVKAVLAAAPKEKP